MAPLPQNGQPRRRNQPQPSTTALVCKPLQHSGNSPATTSTNVGYALPAEEAREIVRVAVKQHWDLQALVQAAKISTPQHLNHRVQITPTNAALGMRHLWQTTGDDLMGLATIGLPPGALRPLTFAVCSAPDLPTAVKRYDEFRTTFTGLPAVTIEQTPAAAILAIDLTNFDTSALSMASVALLLVAHRIINWATRRPLKLHRLELPHPETTRQAGYHTMFGAPPVFNAPRAALVFNTEALTCRFVRSHDEIDHFLHDAPKNLLGECDLHTTLTDQVRHIIEDRLGQPHCTSNEIAAHIGMSRPTLWRRLRDENTSVSQIREQVLRDAALSALARGNQTIAELSQSLGFSEPSAFTRAFRRWTGRSPRNYQPANSATHQHSDQPMQLKQLPPSPTYMGR
ncbi:AraC family transcriptional regulator [Mycobacterium bourgelatii]|uniref:Transcriptional regulator n=1 Tax=Mycobacterium bourgelatii TaxID=1273442 RepID=A0A7I9YL72_MYCBU|nr:AraC family transcriptional regulator [Mycobacterium bourgelatii]MCV6976056.1 AraC family transcriptional regulator ligand-binding domain-containing protein [Mycobacterium bourgelatii]GFG89420.1 transcriptional regulator [Mycobacterium bourgelatii]